MTYLFSRSNREVLEMFAWSNVLLVFDFDGTLAPIVREPTQAVMRPSTRRLLAHAARRYPTVIVSGRGRDDTRRRVRGIPVCQVVGNHGTEPSPDNRRLRRRTQEWLPILSAHLHNCQGIVIENKAYSLAVHYRCSRSRSATKRAILAAAAGLKEVRIIGGKLVVNLVPAGAPHKGLALERETVRFGCDTVIYVGDDETDEDVFVLNWPGRLLPIRVGQKRASAATYYLRNQAEIDTLLGRLIDLRGEPSV